MTGWSDERIPIGVAPSLGEALDSWLERYAHRLRTHTVDFADYLGLPHASVRRMVRRLTEGELELLERRTGVGAEQLRAMTLEAFGGSLVRITGPTRRLRAPAHWRFYGTTSRYCPACLAGNGGRWQVHWRLGWAFACIRHRLLLLERCPRCGKHPPVLSGGNHRMLSRPQACRSLTERDGRGTRCGYPLTEAPAVSLAEGGAVLLSQAGVNAHVIAEHRSAAARERAGELSHLGRRALRNIGARPDVVPPLARDIITACGGELLAGAAAMEIHDARNVAIGTTLAAIATDPRHPLHEDVFAWICLAPDREMGELREHPTRYLTNWKSAGPRVINRILAASDSQLTLKARLRYGTATAEPAVPSLSEADIRVRASKTPGMLWPSWTLRLLPPKSPHQPRIAGLRRACASLMLVPGGPAGHRQGARIMGNPHFRSNLEALLAFVDADHICSTLTHYTRVLDTHEVPIDYARRRALFANEATTLLLDENAHWRLCKSLGTRQFQQVHLYRLRWQLRRLLLGADPQPGNHAPAWTHRFTYRTHPEILAFLDEQAHRNLAAHHITDEPVTWEPPPHWLDNIALPQPPVTTPTERIRALLTPHSTARDVAHTLGLTVHQLRLLMEIRRLSAQTRPHNKGNYPRPPHQGYLVPDRLRDLYQRQGLQQRQIAQLAGCTPGIVKTALKQANIPLRPRRAAGELRRSVDPVWLRTEYHDKGRTVADIARELAAPDSNVSQLLDAWGIPRHPPGHSAPPAWQPSPFASLGVPLSPDMERISTRAGALEELRTALLLPGFRTRRAAALTLGIPRTSLNGRLKKLETAAGFAIFNHRRRPVAPTARGQALLDEAQLLLQRLDTRSRPRPVTCSSSPLGTIHAVLGSVP
ncbi:TniQ family protein [Streptomyces sp. H39-C1]|uniref:TniQ family protein n=1 Tax=Streptomyces sp. H39-C1 TaxID=3004355 RepID=UPI0022AEA007|nr:TniQ family protein [Streptomyces sp. H39-C1]MCZ4101280.1 TniQ family protein [Streptomyces sp. H39-C1]